MWLIIPVLLTIHVLICLLLVLVVLMQLPRSEGLGAAFGGAVTENMFGAQTTHVLARFTVWLGIGFFVITLALAMAYAKQNSYKASAVQKELMSGAAAPAVSPTATPAGTPAAAASSPEAAATPVVEAPAASVPDATPTPAAEVPAVSDSPVAPVAPEAPATAPVTP